MRALRSSEILEVWEAGRERSPLDRALLFLAAARPDRTLEELERLSIARRDAELLELRERTFGPRLAVFAACERCGARADLECSTRELRADGAPSADEFRFEADGWSVRYRIPTSLDLAEALALGDPEAASRTLFGACVLEVSRGDGPRKPDSLPPELKGRIEEAMAESGQAAETVFRFLCPACGSPGRVVLDVASVFWEELSAQARRLLLEVHVLASAYGWSEAEILSLSPVRRQAYLESVSG
jgi:hypothetical protein